MDFESLAQDPTACLNLLKENPREWITLYLEHVGNDVDDLKYGRNKEVEGFDIRSVYEEGDCEGGGDHSEVVFEILYNNRAQGVFFRRTGFYASHYGTEWEDGFSLVEPRPVTEVKYFDIG